MFFCVVSLKNISLQCGFSWNEWLHLPLEFCDLPRTAQLAITIYDCAGPDKLTPVGGTTLSLFSKHGVFREVIQTLFLPLLVHIFNDKPVGNDGFESMA